MEQPKDHTRQENTSYFNNVQEKNSKSSLETDVSKKANAIDASKTSLDCNHLLSPLEKGLRAEATPLTVYKASAGSGKTFTLAVEYIKLLVSDPTNFRYTLAVTFTNKATQEMKQRILSKLYGIANALPDSDDYLTQVKKAFPSLNERVIRNRAGEALTLLVHNYNYFRVETIDSFFQRVLRNLARELGLTANLQVSLNDNEVEAEAVDNMVENIEVETDPLLSWIMDFVQERMADDKSWNVIGQIKDFGRNIFTDFYKDHQDELRDIMNNPEFFKMYTSSLRAMKAQANKAMSEFARQYEAIAARHGLTDDCYYYGHSNAPGYFEHFSSGDYLGTKTKMPNSYITTGLIDPERLVKKAYQNTPEGNAIVNEVAPLLRDAEEARKRAVITVNSVDLTLQNVNELRLLGRIEQEVRNINSANNDYPLSNTQKLLNSLIDRQDSPFIYEKIGGQLRFIMIDEFQDTSTTQWDNFKVLLDDCISHQAGSLIVGDVKQSIYRWRSGDWRLLQNLNESNYPEMVQVKHLVTNYRSQRNVVDFNNSFFTIASKLTADQAEEEIQNMSVQQPGKSAENVSPLLAEAKAIRTAYTDVCQEVPSSRPSAGLVNVELLPKEDYDSNMISKVKDTIEYLLENNTPLNKIAVIVRKNKHIKLLADFFLHNPVIVNGKEMMIKMVSDEAFRLDASLAVNVIVKSFHWLMHPDDTLTAAFLAKAYKKQGNGKGKEQMSDDTLFVNNENIAKFLPVEMNTGRAALLSMPLIDLAEKIYDIFNLERFNDQSAYVCAFFDQLSGYLKKHIAGIDNFLEEWDDSICSKSIQSDEVNGVRMLTVHKSKGLEYDNVIMPFCDWDLEDMRDILWVEPKVKPYSDLPVVPLHLQAKRLKDSIYGCDYESEHIKNLVDNLNILYVAFTRASRNLFVFGKKDGAKYPSEIIRESIENLSYLSDRSPSPSPSVKGDDKPKSIGDLLQGYEIGEDEATGIFYFRYGSLCPSGENSKDSLTPPHSNEDRINALTPPYSNEDRMSVYSPPSEVAEEKSNIFEQEEKGIQINIGTTTSIDLASPLHEEEELGARSLEDGAVSFVQTNASAAFMTPDDELEEQEKRQQYINTGNILHSLFSSIHNYTEVDKAIDQLEFDGVLYDKPMTRSQLRSYIDKELSIPQVHEWFSPRWQVFNECSILYYDKASGHIRNQRPDRVIFDGKDMVVIDFKTGRQLDKHKAQVLSYMQLLHDMGYKNVSGYLWYIRHNEIVGVK